MHKAAPAAPDVLTGLRNAKSSDPYVVTSKDPRPTRAPGPTVTALDGL